MNIHAGERRVVGLKEHVLNNTEYGQIITHEEMSRLIESHHMSQEYYMIIGEAVKQLELQGKTIVNVKDVGYKVLEPDNYASHEANVFAKGMKYIERAKKINDYAPVGLMSKDKKASHSNVGRKVTSFASLVLQRAEEIRQASTGRE